MNTEKSINKCLESNIAKVVPNRKLKYPKDKDIIDLRLFTKNGWIYKSRHNNHLQSFKLSIWQNMPHLPGLCHREYAKLLLTLRRRELTDEALGQIGRSLKNLKALQNLNIDIRLTDQFKDHGLRYISRHFYALRKLDTISICLKRCFKLGDYGMLFLSNNLRKMKILKSLSLDFEHVAKIGDQGLFHLAHNLSNLQSLESLHININQCSATTSGISALAYLIPKLKSLQILRFDVSSCEMEDDFYTMLSNSLSKSPQLKQIMIFSNYCVEITGNGLCSLSQSLENLKELNRLEVSMLGCDKIEDNVGVDMLINSVEKLTTNLEILRLHLSSADFNRIFEMISLLPNLKELYLVLNSWKDENPVVVPESFFANNQKLTRLTLMFENCFDISDDHIAIMGEQLSLLKNLRYLNAHFFGVNVNKEGMLIFLDCLKKLNGLQDLRLYFERRVVSRELIKSLAESIAGMENLTNLDLTFFCASFIEDIDVKMLSDALIKLDHLSILILNLTGCKEITDEGVYDLLQSFSLMKSLRGLKVDLRGCPELTVEGLLRSTELISTWKGLVKSKFWFNRSFLIPEVRRKFAVAAGSLPKLVCFYLNQQNILAYNYKESITVYPEYWFGPRF